MTKVAGTFHVPQPVSKILEFSGHGTRRVPATLTFFARVQTASESEKRCVMKKSGRTAILALVAGMTATKKQLDSWMFPVLVSLSENEQVNRDFNEIGD